jgi:DNA-binding Lrp family transcriptional regulator
MRAKKLLNLKYRLTYTDLMIVDALSKYTPRNIFKIARELEMAESTVRYRINMMKRKGLLKLYTNVYHTNIGLKKAVVFSEINPRYYDNIGWFMDVNGFWTYMIGLHGYKEMFHTLYIIPVDEMDKLNDFLDEMVNLDIIRNYKIYYSTCFHKVNPSVTWYDLTKDDWNFGWDTLINDIERAETDLPITLKDPKEFPIKADTTDIMLLRYLEKDATISYTDLAKSMKTTPQNIRYHFKQHIEKNFLIEDYEILLLKYPPETSFIMYMILEFPNYTSLAKLANVFRARAFTEVLGKILDQHKLIAVAHIPMEEMVNLIKVLNKMVAIGYLKDFEYYIAHAKDSGKRQTIPYKMFRGDHWDYPHEDMIRELHRRFDLVNGSTQVDLH